MTGLTIRTALIGLGLLFLLTSGHTLAADSGEADRLIERLQARLAGCRDYQYRMSCYERCGEREEERSYRVFVKDGRLVRIQVTAGRGRGSEAVLNARGQVRARKGGVLRAFARTLSPTDRRVCGLRGTPFWDAACHNFLAALQGRMTRPGAHCTLAPERNEPGVQVLHLQLPGGTHERYWIDLRAMHLVRGEIFEGDVLVHRFSISEIRENVGLSDSFFAF
jgi:outer membrane lipoprotein-sorting protein